MGAFRITRRSVLCRLGAVATGLAQVLRGGAKAAGTSPVLVLQEKPPVHASTAIDGSRGPGAGGARPHRPEAHTRSFPTGKPVVAIGRCEGYGASSVETVLRQLVGLCGGLTDVIRPGDTVVIKPNLTDAGRTPMPDGTPAIMSYTTHPDVVRAIGLVAKEAEAGRIILAEGRSSETWINNEYDGLIAELGAEVLEVLDPAPALEFARVPVREQLALDHVWLNEVIAEADVLISVAKLKCHTDAGITAAIKNLVGVLSTAKYMSKPNQPHRGAIHTGDWSERLPKVIVDILKARPIHFSVVDGISTIDQGEGPWKNWRPGITIRPVQPGVLLAGRDPVAVDSVCAAVMGFDPQAPHYTSPFLCGLNHLSLAEQAGLGTNRLGDIDVRGTAIEDAMFAFTPCPAAGSSTPTPGPSPTREPSPSPEGTATPGATPTEAPTPGSGSRAYLPLVRK